MTVNGPFATIESAQEFLALLARAIEDATAEATMECSACANRQQERAVAAWRLVLYKMARLSQDVAHSRGVLDELRTLRNLLHRTNSAPQTDAPLAGTAAAVPWCLDSPGRRWVEQ